ncbi:MAG: flagellar hook-length control protein FliK [Candidatus Thiodiazotropha sp.]
MPFSIAKILPPLPTTTSAKSLLEAIQPGQLLKGTALSENLNGAMRLQIGVTQLTAQTTLSVTPGQSLLLQVEKAGKLPELRVLTQPTQKELTAWALKSNLPRQQPLPQLFRALTQLVSDPQAKPLPEPVRQAVTQVLTGALSIDKPAFKTELNKALQLSGTQTESLLIRQMPTNQDLKLNLLRLIGVIKPYLAQSYEAAGIKLPLTGTPGAATANPSSPATTVTIPNQILLASSQTALPAQSMEANPTLKLLLDLFKHIDGAIARIQTNQLSSLPPTDESARQIWQFELPIRHENGFDLFHVKIARDGKHGAAAQSGWQLTLHMNLQPLGPMRIRLHLVGESLSTTIWSENPDTSKLVSSQLDRLRIGFETAGLEVKKLESFQGAARNEQQIPGEHSLLNEQA